MAILDQIVAAVRADLPARRAAGAGLERQVATLAPAPDFRAALRGERIGVIAEVKRRSPSAGAINPGLDPVALATAYAAGGASAISVLTEGPHFGGSLGDLTAVAAAVERPILRKDFILEEIQLLEARAAGAAAVLLIARILDDPTLVRLDRFASAIGLATLVEVHDQPELERALDAGVAVVGVNARNLDDFSMDVAAAWELLALIPADRVAVAESGMTDAADVGRAAEAGADAVLVGGALAAAGEPAARVAEMAGVARRGR